MCDRMVDILTEEHGPLTDDILAMFSNSQAAQLSCIDLRHSDVTCEGLQALRCQPLTELSMHCQWSCFPVIKALHRTLRSLRLDKMAAVVDPIHLRPLGLYDRGISGVISAGLEQSRESSPISVFDEDSQFFALTCPNLRKLVLQDLKLVGSPLAESFVKIMLSPLGRLTHLSLAGTSVQLEQLDCFGTLTGLVSLNISNIPISDFPTVLQNLSCLSNLRHLDLSQGDEDIIPVIYNDSDNYLKDIMSTFPALVSLDLSGTNLAGFESPDYVSHRMEATKKEKKKEERSSIPGLEGRHLEFLGLLGCAYAACSRSNIPASRVTGDANASQVLLAVHVYIDNHWLLIKSLNDLFNLFRFSTVPNHRIALEAILAAMKNYPADSSIQIAGRAMISLLIKAMREHQPEQTMMRNACLTLCHLNLPDAVMFCYERLVDVLLSMLRHDYRDEFIHRLGIFLLNCLACQVDGKEKELVGNMGAVDTMLSIIERKLKGGDCDDVLEVAWSTLWNVTDETPSNCHKFMIKGGMELFLQCLQKFNDKPELLRNMMGLMGNIAEVDWLRPKLMCEEYVNVFSELLESTSDGIEVSYNACGVLSHLCFDGPQAWMIPRPSRSEVLARMEQAINRWPINSKRNINYRSFEPILRLVAYFETPQVQHWAVWALCNLTAVSPEKYCRLLEREGGREALTRVVSSQSYRRIRELAQRTLNQLDIKDLSCSSSSGQEESSEHVAHANEGMEAEEDEEVEERMSEEEEEEEDGREEEDDFLEDEDQRPDGGELDGDLDNGFVIL
ncbi:hypothetical protein C0Q70_17695 [Pomacea canaliculata]|uniref:Protein zer-1 homolog n=1 Tax=Pomacea canaliculata TaxID=400727 RepID=A0A2T7NL51_POMCA|nr:hypothetical protein C0Q70_17695 [Pomacea canaliculata]